MKNKVRSNESLCEKSMKMVTNMVKLSSLSISMLSLGISGPLPATKNVASVTASFMVVDKPPPPQFSGNRRSQEPQTNTKPLYLVEPVAGNGSSSNIREDNSIDRKASAYIEKVYKKIRGASNETTNHSEFIMPPPPPPPPPPRVVK